MGAKAAGLHTEPLGGEAQQVIDGPGGPRVACSPAPPPPQAQQPHLMSVAPLPGSQATNARNSKGGKRGSNTPRAGSNGTVARESAVAAEAVERFRKRDSKGSEVALKTVRAALEHVLEKPTEEKYRCLKGSNARVKSEISAFPEAVQILRLAGFSLVGEDLVLPERAPLQTIRDVLVGLSHCMSNQSLRIPALPLFSRVVEAMDLVLMPLDCFFSPLLQSTAKRLGILDEELFGEESAIQEWNRLKRVLLGLLVLNVAASIVTLVLLAIFVAMIRCLGILN